MAGILSFVVVKVVDQRHLAGYFAAQTSVLMAAAVGVNSGSAAAVEPEASAEVLIFAEAG